MQTPHEAQALSPERKRRGPLDWIEWLGNKIPDPVLLFVGACAIVLLGSWVASSMGWEVQPVRPQQVLDAAGNPVLDASGRPVVELAPQVGADGAPVEPIRAKNLLTADGVYWMLTTAVDNFVKFPPLGVVLVAILGVGVAERSGLIGAALKAAMLVVPAWLLTPAVVFVGITSSVASDSGYIVLPPLAAALYRANGRSPLAGVAAVMAGVAGGFSANLMITSSDPLLAGLTQTGARVVDPDYTVNAACNWYFMAAATIFLTFVGWGVSSLIVEPRLSRRSPEDGGPCVISDDDLASQQLTLREWHGLAWAAAATGLCIAGIAALILIPGAPLYTPKTVPPTPTRWFGAVVPLIAAAFLIPGTVYGAAAGTIRGPRDVVRAMSESVAGVAPMLVLVFFAGQFLAWFGHSNLNRLIAFSLGTRLPPPGSTPTYCWSPSWCWSCVSTCCSARASAKWAMLAPVFVPVFMFLGLSPELTQAAYRVSDSVTNPITPLNAYLPILLGVVQRYAPRAGIGTLMSMMAPYSLVFAIFWTGLLLCWIGLEIPLGPGGSLHYIPTRPG